MSDNLQEPNLNDSGDQPEELTRSDERRKRIEERRAARSGNAWIPGVILVLVGVFLMMQNLGARIFNNWWALFILIPALGAFANAWRAYQEAGRQLTNGARNSLFGGLILTWVAAMFLFNLNWSLLGPILLIVIGIGIFLNVSLQK
jgi:Flp pilus assembly protein TadB